MTNPSNKVSIVQFFSRYAHLWYSIIVGAFAAAIIAITLLSISSQAREHVNRLTQNTATGIASLLQQNLIDKMNTSVTAANSTQFKENITDQYIESLIPSYLLIEHQFVLSVNGKKRYSNQSTTLGDQSEWSRQSSFTLDNQTWHINILPKADFLNNSYFKMNQILLWLGILLWLFICLSVYAALSARNKARVINDDRNKVAHLLKNLPGMAYQSWNQENWPMIFASEGCLTVTGYTKQEYETHSILWGKIIHSEDYHRVYQTVNQAIKNNSLFELEYRILTKDNRIRLIWERGEAVKSIINNESIIEGFITDITNIKQAEVDLLRSHEFSDAIVKSVVEAVITIDQKGLIQSFNDAAEKMFGYTVDEIKNKNINLLMPQEYASKHDDYLSNYLKTNKSAIIGNGRELEAQRKDGSIFPIHLSVNEIKNQQDRVFVGLIRDITQQRAADDQKRIHIEQMAHADRLNSLGEMAAGIAHEINQPLTTISLYSESGKKLCGRGDFARMPEIFDKLSQHSHRAGAVLERMQAMTKRGDRQKELVDCFKLINEVANLAEPDARMRDINIKFNHCKIFTQVFVDVVQIQQVLLNLLRNGMEAMQDRGLENGNIIELQMQLMTQKSVKISVIDTGCGLSDSMVCKLFTPFSSTKKNGTGIGLSISKSIIEEHGGSIHYAKNPTAGSAFYFILPTVQSENSYP
ncbi:PAS domain-containing sensor histidine kinase [Paraglaciecola sp. L3A3]|uniref:PAS domain-containing sensor histidine kinase n=1 Tax=Paraglaciecola sp. L3A3 TaxID=2686358 RepID=UPI00131C0060|nr:PAS domain-containing sensor histidine kinase [Paraglaciecola sp. L3A3]